MGMNTRVIMCQILRRVRVYVKERGCFCFSTFNMYSVTKLSQCLKVQPKYSENHFLKNFFSDVLNKCLCVTMFSSEKTLFERPKSLVFCPFEHKYISESANVQELCA